MALNPLYTDEKLPATSLAALREFDDRYLALLLSTPPSGWHVPFCEMIGSNAPMVTFPIVQLALKYMRATGEDLFKTFGSKSFDIRGEEFLTGFEGDWYLMSKNSFEYRRWNEGPALMIEEENNFVAEKVAALFEAGESTALYDGSVGVNFFSASHPANLFENKGTFSNYNSNATSVLSVANIATEVTAGRKVRDSQGRYMNVNFDTILVPLDLVEPLTNYLAKENLGIYTSSDAGNVVEPNPYKGRFNVVGVRDFTDADDWYLVDSKLCKRFRCCIAFKETVDQALALKEWDQNSELFKRTNKIAKAAHIWYGFSLGFPHAIRKIKGA